MRQTIYLDWLNIRCSQENEDIKLWHTKKKGIVVLAFNFSVSFQRTREATPGEYIGWRKLHAFNNSFFHLSIILFLYVCARVFVYLE